MQESNKKQTTIKKYGFYAYLKGLEKGLGIIIFEENNDTIEGVKLGIGKTEKVSFKRETFESLLIYDYLEFVELLPKKVWKEFKKIYEK